MLFLQLATPLSLFPLNTVPVCGWQHPLILDSQLPSLQLHMIHNANHHLRFVFMLEVRKGQTSEDAVIKMIVESVRHGKSLADHYILQLLLLDGKGNVLDDNRSKNVGLLFFGVSVRGCDCHGPGLEHPISIWSLTHHLHGVTNQHFCLVITVAIAAKTHVAAEPWLQGISTLLRGSAGRGRGLTEGIGGLLEVGVFMRPVPPMVLVPMAAPPP